jgi:multidrug efflux pump subunit AcrA (membrane-fusion protein)
VQPTTRIRTAVLETTGKVQFDEDQLVRVNAPVTGRVIEVLARPGELVETGHPLFVLDSADLAQAKSDYAKAVSDLSRSERASKLAKDLFEMKAIAEKDIREAENDLNKAVAERDRAAARLRTLGVRPDQFPDIGARADASTTVTVRAPRSGVVVERNISPGQVVSYGQSDTPVSLFVIANLSTMWVLADRLRARRAQGASGRKAVRVHPTLLPARSATRARSSTSGPPWTRTAGPSRLAPSCPIRRRASRPRCSSRWPSRRARGPQLTLPQSRHPALRRLDVRAPGEGQGRVRAPAR